MTTRLLLVSTLCLLGGCNYVTRLGHDKPYFHRVSSEEIPGVIRAIPYYTAFSYSGISFFNGKLYASTNVGLLEVEGGKPAGLYKWYDQNDVVSGPWPDPADGMLWARHEGLDKLLRYDGKVWNVTEQISPGEGFMRGDILAGFRGTGTPEGFWLEGGRHAWRWDGQADLWQELQAPPEGYLARVAPVSTKVLVVMRHDPLPSLVRKGEEFKSDTIHYYEGGWKEVPNNTGKSFFAQQVIIVGDVAYILTSEGEIFRLTPAGITEYETPGECETIAATTSGTLLASFSKLGIYEYSNGWQKRFSPPYPDTEPEHWAYLAESNGQVAFAITSKPSGEESRKSTSQTALWVSRGDTLEVVKLGGGY